MWSACNEPVEPLSAAPAFSTKVSDDSMSVATSPTGTCMRVPGRGGPRMSLIGLRLFGSQRGVTVASRSQLGLPA